MFGNDQVLASVFSKTLSTFLTFYWNYLLCDHVEIMSLLTFTVVAEKRLFTCAIISVISNIIHTFSSVLTRVAAARKLVCNVRKHHWHHYFLFSLTKCLLHTKPHTMAVASHYDSRICIPGRIEADEWISSLSSKQKKYNVRFRITKGWLAVWLLAL